VTSRPSHRDDELLRGGGAVGDEVGVGRDRPLDQRQRDRAELVVAGGRRQVPDLAVAGEPYAVPQQLAAQFDGARRRQRRVFDGIRFRTRFDPDTSARGVAMFGDQGLSATESAEVLAALDIAPATSTGARPSTQAADP